MTMYADYRPAPYVMSAQAYDECLERQAAGETLSADTLEDMATYDAVARYESHTL